MKKIFIIIPVVFVAALAVGVGLQVLLSPEYNNQDKEQPGEPVVTYHEAGSDQKQGPDGAPLYNWMDHPVFVIGDSLTKGAKSEIEKAVSGVKVDAQEGRNMTAGLAILKDWNSSGILPDDAIIVINLAHNITPATVQDAEEIVGLIRSGQSLIMMTGHGNSNMDPINEYIRSLPKTYSFITAADWDQTIVQSPRLLADDGIHIRYKQGNELYADLILKALKVTQPKP